jgi:hypothetical protein
MVPRRLSGNTKVGSARAWVTGPQCGSMVDESRSSLSAGGSVGCGLRGAAEGYGTGFTTNATPGSSDDTVAQVGHARSFEYPDQLECGLTRLEPVEQALTRTEHHRVDLKIDLVD